jgi:hypothetical protein
MVSTSDGHIFWKWAMTDEYFNSHRGYATSPYIAARSWHIILNIIYYLCKKTKTKRKPIDSLFVLNMSFG